LASGRWRSSTASVGRKRLRPRNFANPKSLADRDRWPNINILALNQNNDGIAVRSMPLGQAYTFG